MESFPSSSFGGSEVVTLPFLGGIHFEVVVEDGNSTGVGTFVGIVVVENVVFESDDHSTVRTETVTGRFGFQYTS